MSVIDRVSFRNDFHSTFNIWSIFSLPAHNSIQEEWTRMTTCQRHLATFANSTLGRFVSRTANRKSEQTVAPIMSYACCTSLVIPSHFFFYSFSHTGTVCFVPWLWGGHTDPFLCTAAYLTILFVSTSPSPSLSPFPSLGYVGKDCAWLEDLFFCLFHQHTIFALAITLNHAPVFVR